MSAWTVKPFYLWLCLRLWLTQTFYLHRDTALQLELQLDHVHLLAGAELGQLRRSRLHLIDGHVHRFELQMLLPHHLHTFLHIREGVGSWRWHSRQNWLDHACERTNKLRETRTRFSLTGDLSAACCAILYTTKDTVATEFDNIHSTTDMTVNKKHTERQHLLFRFCSNRSWVSSFIAANVCTQWGLRSLQKLNTKD